MDGPAMCILLRSISTPVHPTMPLRLVLQPSQATLHTITAEMEFMEKWLSRSTAASEQPPSQLQRTKSRCPLQEIQHQRSEENSMLDRASANQIRWNQSEVHLQTSPTNCLPSFTSKEKMLMSCEDSHSIYRVNSSRATMISPRSSSSLCTDVSTSNGSRECGWISTLNKGSTTTFYADCRSSISNMA